MDLLEEEPGLNLNDRSWRIYSLNPNQPAQYIAPTATIKSSILNEGCAVMGTIDHSVLFYGVRVGEGSVIKDSVIMPGVKIGENCVVNRAIIGEGTMLADGSVVGDPDSKEITLVGSLEIVT